MLQIHLFGEGKVNQSIRTPGHSPADLLRFKWGMYALFPFPPWT